MRISDIPLSIALMLGLGFATTASYAGSFAQPSLPFIANAGQHDARVLFHSSISGGSVFITTGGTIIYTLTSASPNTDATGVALEEHFVNAQLNQIHGLDRSLVSVSYFLNADSFHWQRDLPTYDRLSLGQIYPGVECTLHSGLNNVEKLFTVAPGATPEQIRLRIDGASALRVLNNGQLEIRTELGSATFTQPIAYQLEESNRHLVEIAYDVDGLEYGFKLGEYDRSLPLVIDPLLASTYFGGSGNEGRNFSSAICLGPDGSVYLTGLSDSPDLPTTPGVFGETYGGVMDVFIARFNHDLSQLLSATYIGGSNLDGYDRDSPRVLVGDDGRVYVTGQTLSADFPTTEGAFDREYNGGYDIFLSCLNADLTELLYSTFVGSTGDDWVTAIKSTANGDVVIAGHSREADYPTTPGAYDREFSGYGTWYFGGDTVISRFSPDLSTLIASTYLGGTGYEFDTNLSIAADGSFYLSGTTCSFDFPIIPGAYNDSHATGVSGHAGDIFVARMSEDLTTLLASTYIGAGRDDWSNNILAAPDGYIYVGGHSCSVGFPVTPDAYDTTYNGPTGIDVANDVVLAKFDPDLTTLLAATYIGGDEWEMSMELAYDPDGYLYVGGHGRCDEGGVNFPATPGAFCAEHNGDGGGLWIGDGFICRIDTDLSVMSACTFFGGTGQDALTDIQLDSTGDIFFCGYSNSTDLPMAPNAYDSLQHGGTDAYVAKLDKMLCACPGDLGGDGAIDLNDLAQLLGHYGASRAAYSQGDLNGDGTIDLDDLAQLLSVYGHGCN